MITQMKYMNRIGPNQKSEKSNHPWQSVIQTIYDIVKAHGGALKVETFEGNGSTFFITLPISSS
jgi:light-regulated signal transduction histidine kinase (bacteriophytochrome)